jgi:hypothetical protein
VTGVRNVNRGARDVRPSVSRGDADPIRRRMQRDAADTRRDRRTAERGPVTRISPRDSRRR